jgi:hypothetical protein
MRSRLGCEYRQNPPLRVSQQTNLTLVMDLTATFVPSRAIGRKLFSATGGRNKKPSQAFFVATLRLPRLPLPQEIWTHCLQSTATSFLTSVQNTDQHSEVWWPLSLRCTPERPLSIIVFRSYSTGHRIDRKFVGLHPGSANHLF